MRVLHFSDIHLPLRLRRVPLSRWFGKRALGGANLLFGRAKVFARGFEKMEALARFREEQGIDLVIFTGDYVNLGTEVELRQARAAVDPLTRAPAGYAHVPGNHDFYVRQVQRRAWWRSTFGELYANDLPEYAVGGSPWPYVRLVGDDVAIVAVNSARPNPPWLSSGAIPEDQLAGMRRALADPALAGRFVFVISHYAPRLEDGKPDTPHHGLDNADDYLDACAAVPRGAILCGHVHRRYTVEIDGVPPPLFCAGSATFEGREGIWVFDIDGGEARATPGHWRDDRYELGDAISI